MLTLGIVISSFMFYNQYKNFAKLSGEYNQLYQRYTTLKEENERLSEFFNETKIGPGSSIRRVLILDYNRWNRSYPPTDYGEPVAVIYVYQANSTLKLDLIMYYTHPDLFIPLSVQKGDAFDSKYATETKAGHPGLAPILWHEPVNETGSFSIPLREKGWYTISITGPISLGGGRSFIGVKWDNDDVIVLTLSVQLAIHVYIEDEQAPFAVNDFRGLGFP